MQQYFVRVGVFGHVGRFLPVDASVYPRTTRVICRTTRGLEVGEVLAPVDTSPWTPDGQVLRRVTVEDDLLLARLDKHRNEAFEACQSLIERHHIPAVLTDVEHLFDGQSLYFYFLGPTPPELDPLTQELADLYETKVEFRKFLETLTDGCGPGCGTEDAENGCGSGGCATCVVASACHSKRTKIKG